MAAGEGHILKEGVMNPVVDGAREARIRRALDHLRKGTTDEYHMQRRFKATDYTDPDLAERERELIFGRVPTIVAHRTQLPEPNDFITLDMPRNKVIIARQRDGGVKAFVNQCRHRGALLEENKSGRCRLFSCPYHRWSYDTDGSLRTITRDETFGEVDRSQYGLVELPVEERHGFIWLVDNAQADIDVAAWLGPEMDEVLAGYRLEELVCYRAEGFDQPVNWKIMQDAFLDGYHIQYAHPNSAAKHIHTNVMAFEDFGRHVRFTVPRKSIDRYIEEDPGDKSLARHVTETHWIGPNATLLRQPDDHFELLLFRPHPSDPTKGYMEMQVLVPRQEDSGMEPERWERLWDKNWQILVKVLHQEDFPILRSAQQALASKDAGSMILGRNETANHVFHREFWRLLGEDGVE